MLALGKTSCSQVYIEGGGPCHKSLFHPLIDLQLSGNIRGTTIETAGGGSESCCLVIQL